MIHIGESLEAEEAQKVIYLCIRVGNQTLTYALTRYLVDHAMFGSC